MLAIHYTLNRQQMKREAYPTLFAMAMDYLPIQASSVPCEHVFSSSAETMTKRRNCINVTLMEALQMLKFHFKKQRPNFMDGWITQHEELVRDEPEEPAVHTQNDISSDIQVIDDIIKGILLEESSQMEMEGQNNDIVLFPLHEE